MGSGIASDDEIIERVKTAAEAALEKKAFQLDVLKVGELTSISDYFVICSTGSERQSDAVADAIEEKMREVHGLKPLVVEGRRTGHWILLDFGDFVAHVFTEEWRRFYALERLWGDAPNIRSDLIGGEATAETPGQ